MPQRAMLRDGDLDAFLSLLQAAKADGNTLEAEQPGSALRVPENGLFPSEIWCLFRSLQIAEVLGDAPKGAALAAGRIAKACERDMQCKSLDDQDAWRKAIRWSIFRPEAGSEDASLQLFERQRQVGLAGARLRERGYGVRISAYGPEIDTRSRQQIAVKIDSLFGLLGGADGAGQVCRFIRDSKLLHDGMWMFGDKVPNIHQTKVPSVPLGWLFSLAVRHLGKRGTARKADIAWGTAVKLSTDMAACMDCQRYNQ